MADGKKWKIGIVLSSDGFEGVQFLTPSRQARVEVFKFLPRLHPVLSELDRAIKEEIHETEDMRNFQSPGFGNA